MSRDVFVAGVGMIPFAKPGKSDPYFQMGSSATSLALADAGLAYGRSAASLCGLCLR